MKSLCKDCGGSQICDHNRERRRCRNCGGSGICDHDRRRSDCKDCKTPEAEGETPGFGSSSSSSCGDGDNSKLQINDLIPMANANVSIEGVEVDGTDLLLGLSGGGTEYKNEFNKEENEDDDDDDEDANKGNSANSL